MCSPRLSSLCLQCVLSIEALHFDLLKYINHWSAYTGNYESKNSTYAHLQYSQEYQTFSQGATFLEYMICPLEKGSLWERIYFKYKLY